MNQPDIVVYDSLPNKAGHVQIAKTALKVMGANNLKMPYTKYPLWIVPYMGRTKLEGGLFAKRLEGVWYLAINCRDYPKFNRQALILIHELIHAVQFANGDLELDRSPYVLIWKGTKYNLNEIKYLDRPWEKEAYAKQDDVYRKVRSKLGF